MNYWFIKKTLEAQEKGGDDDFEIEWVCTFICIMCLCGLVCGIIYGIGSLVGI